MFLHHPKLKALGQGVAGQQQPAPGRLTLRLFADARSSVQSAALDHLRQQLRPLAIRQLKQPWIRVQQQLLCIAEGCLAVPRMAGAQQSWPQTGPDPLFCCLGRSGWYQLQVLWSRLMTQQPEHPHQTLMLWAVVQRLQPRCRRVVMPVQHQPCGDLPALQEQPLRRWWILLQGLVQGAGSGVVGGTGQAAGLASQSVGFRRRLMG